jgi:hypothetical protein
VTYSLTQLVERRFTEDRILARAAAEKPATTGHTPGAAGAACPGCVHAVEAARVRGRQS